jgi:hypothetical protein
MECNFQTTQINSATRSRSKNSFHKKTFAPVMFSQPITVCFVENLHIGATHFKFQISDQTCRLVFDKQFLFYSMCSLINDDHIHAV